MGGELKTGDIKVGQIKTAYICETGLVRKENQDAFFQQVGDSISVFCVADGMGGHANGKRASTAIVDGVREWVDGFYAEKYESDFLMILDDFEKKMAGVNERLFKYYNNGQVCGSTFVALVIFEPYYAVFSLGDSRVYRKRRLDFSQLTSDDTWENSDQVPAGMTPEAMKGHRNYGKLTRGFGLHESFVLHRLTDRLQAGDTFLLCSDGILKCCGMDVLKEACGRNILKKNDSLMEKLDFLEQTVIRKGAPDNYTAVLVRVGDGLGKLFGRR